VGAMVVKMVDQVYLEVMGWNWNLLVFFGRSIFGISRRRGWMVAMKAESRFVNDCLFL
jgi:hypothetical protein